MQNRSQLFPTLLISTLIHIGLVFLVSMLFSMLQIQFADGLVRICCLYVPFAISGAVIGVYPNLWRPVLAALISAPVALLVLENKSFVLAVPAILISCLSAFCTNSFNADDLDKLD